MKIVDNTTLLRCTFGDLPPLATFKCDGNFYMKTPYSLFTTPDGYAEEVNAFCLTTGESERFPPGEAVYRVEATLTITPFASSSC